MFFYEKIYKLMHITLYSMEDMQEVKYMKNIVKILLGGIEKAHFGLDAGVTKKDQNDFMAFVEDEY
jgi:hypothetical protein